MPMISLEDLTVEYQRSGYTVRPLDRLNRQIHDGTLTLLLGPSGCGKTTLLSCLGGLLTPTAGRIVIGSTDLTRLDDEGRREYRRTRVGFVFQAFNLLSSLDARDNVAAPLVSQGVSRKAARAAAERVLAEVGMAEHARSKPGELSGGQQQRVAVARGLVHGPEVLLADEPTANLDYVQAEAVIALLRSLAQPGRLVLISTHDDRLLPIADEVIDLTPRVAEAPAAGTGARHLVAGEVLFREGDRSDLIYEVVHGAMELVRARSGAEQQLSTAEPGRWFGELGVMMGQPRTATARALVDTELLGMTLPEFRARSRAAAHDATTNGRADGPAPAKANGKAKSGSSKDGSAAKPARPNGAAPNDERPRRRRPLQAAPAEESVEG